MGGVCHIELGSFWDVDWDNSGYLPPNTDSPDDSDDMWNQLKDCVGQLKRNDEVPPQFSAFRFVLCGRKSCWEKLQSLLKEAKEKASPTDYAPNPSSERERQLFRQKEEAVFTFHFREDGRTYQTSIGVFRNPGTRLSVAKFDQICNLLKKATKSPPVWEGPLKDWMKKADLDETMIWWRLYAKDDPRDNIQNAHKYFRLGSPELWRADYLNIREIHDGKSSPFRSMAAPTVSKKDHSFVRNMGVNIDLLITAPGITERAKRILEQYKAPPDPDWVKKAVAAGAGDDDPVP